MMKSEVSDLNEDDLDLGQELDTMVIWEKYQEFDLCSFNSEVHQSMADFVNEWQQKRCAALAVGCHFSDWALVFKLLDKSKLHFVDVEYVVTSLSMVDSSRILTEAINKMILIWDGKPQKTKKKKREVPIPRAEINYELKKSSSSKGLKEITSLVTPIDPSTYMATETDDHGDDKLSQALLHSGIITEEIPQTSNEIIVETVTIEDNLLLHDGDDEEIAYTEEYVIEGKDIKEDMGEEEEDEDDEDEKMQVGVQPPEELKENQCPICFKFLSRKYDVKFHMQTHNKVKEFSCDECGDLFASRFNLAKHLKLKICERRRERKKELQNSDRRFGCEFCHKRFVRKDDLISHRRIHTGEKPFACHFCNQTFGNKKELFVHKKEHPEFVFYTCRTCNKDYGSLETYKLHALQSHGIEVNPEGDFECELCQERTLNVNAYKMHMMLHGVSHQCNECGISFPDVRQLKQHSFQHDNRRFECHTCGKAFTYLSNLKSHMRTHTGEKPYECQVCRRRFAIKKTLNVHSRVHTKEKPYFCEQCGRSFAHNSVLTKHKRTHMGSKPYTCPICSKSFQQQHHIKQHLKSHKEHSREILGN